MSTLRFVKHLTTVLGIYIVTLSVIVAVPQLREIFFGQDHFLQARSTSIEIDLPTPMPVEHTNPLVFYIDPALVPDIAAAKLQLQKYVSDMNIVLAKNTTRRVSFNPTTGIVLTTEVPYSSSCCASGLTMPRHDFTVMVHIQKTLNGATITSGGSTALHSDGSGVISGMRWPKIHDASTLSTALEHGDYWRQVYTMLHEFGHLFGVATGEYYHIGSVRDNTNVEPKYEINSLNGANDPYWSERTVYFRDPMNGNVMGNTFFSPVATTRELALQHTRFSPLSAKIISNSYRGLPNNDRLPNMDSIVLKAVDATTGSPITGATIKAWQIDSVANDAAYFQGNFVTNSLGKVLYDWSLSTANYHNNIQHLRYFKVFREGYLPKVVPFSVYDAEEVKLLDGLSSLEIMMVMSRDPNYVDTVAPSIVLKTPVNGATVKGSVTVLGTASDNVGLTSVQLLVDGVRVAKVAGSVTPSLSWNTTTATNGTHILQLVTQDFYGNTAVSQKIKVIVNN